MKRKYYYESSLLRVLSLFSSGIYNKNHTSLILVDVFAAVTAASIIVVAATTTTIKGVNAVTAAAAYNTTVIVDFALFFLPLSPLPTLPPAPFSLLLPPLNVTLHVVFIDSLGFQL